MAYQEEQAYWDQAFRPRAKRELSRGERNLYGQPITRSEIKATDEYTEAELRERTDLIPHFEKEQMEVYRRVFDKIDKVVKKQHEQAPKPMYVFAGLTASGIDRILIGSTNYYMHRAHGRGEAYTNCHAEELLFKNFDLLVEKIEEEKAKQGEAFKGVDFVVTIEPCGGRRYGIEEEPCSIIALNKLQELEKRCGPCINKVVIGATDPEVYYSGLINLTELGIPIHVLAPMDTGPTGDHDKEVLQAIAAINKRQVEGSVYIPPKGEDLYPGSVKYTNKTYIQTIDPYATRETELFFQELQEESARKRLKIGDIIELIKEKGFIERDEGQLINNVKQWVEKVKTDKKGNTFEDLKKALMYPYKDAARYRKSRELAYKSAVYYEENNLPSPIFEDL